MREIIIRRQKSFVGCLMKMKVYAEDAAQPELTICGVPCRKLGELKNGQEGSFFVSEEAVRIFVIADKATKDYCVDCFHLDAGCESVCLSGKNKFNLANGNAFRFDNNESEEAATYRKNGSKKGVVVMCVAALVGVVVGFLISSDIFQLPASPQTFVCDEMCITLTSEFEEEPYEGLRACYESDEVLVFVLKEEFSAVEGLQSLSLEQYGDLVRDNLMSSSFEPSEPVVQNNRLLIQYKANSDDTILVCNAYAFKGQDAFWIVRFVTTDESDEKFASQIEEWAASISLV